MLYGTWINIILRHGLQRIYGLRNVRSLSHCKSFRNTKRKDNLTDLYNNIERGRYLMDFYTIMGSTLVPPIRRFRTELRRWLSNLSINTPFI